ncbi:transcriptional regulator, AraC family [Singulisphaera sp. GP187]|uniref:AraC family transcriptional regulator n=1 Tax=Singulisphaera sp. GP187 TaxID=1882752 RepID=UPI000928C7CA|nr:AraC family transcriptional regulator [Singulisphaera sp. GP187]SIO29615.1 transcriptional regulator, AraC family [Singulisphaera sp. GP187]
MFAAKLTELAALIERITGQDGSHATAIAPLSLHRLSAPSDPVTVVVEPALCVVARGRKRVMLAEEVLVYDPAHFLLVSVDLPLVGQVVEASPEEPYLSVRIDLDLGQVGEVLLDAEIPHSRDSAPRRGLAVSAVDPPLLDAVSRLISLLESPRDIQVMAPLILREITYRVLMGEQGLRLRQIVAEGGQAQRIALAIDWLKRNFARSFRIEDLARETHMSPSAFHQHFKAVTAMSPLQYQKRLRLQEARRLMLGESLDASAAAYRVGYESPSQFSREYQRCFGEPPRRDLARIRALPYSTPA